MLPSAACASVATESTLASGSPSSSQPYLTAISPSVRLSAVITPAGIREDLLAGSRLPGIGLQPRKHLLGNIDPVARVHDAVNENQIVALRFAEGIDLC